MEATRSKCIKEGETNAVKIQRMWWLNLVVEPRELLVEEKRVWEKFWRKERSLVSRGVIWELGRRDAKVQGSGGANAWRWQVNGGLGCTRSLVTTRRRRKCRRHTENVVGNVIWPCSFWWRGSLFSWGTGIAGEGCREAERGLASWGVRGSDSSWRSMPQVGEMNPIWGALRENPGPTAESGS